MPLPRFSCGNPSGEVLKIFGGTGIPLTRIVFGLSVGNVRVPVELGGITTVHSITPSEIFQDDVAVP